MTLSHEPPVNRIGGLQLENFVRVQSQQYNGLLKHWQKNLSRLDEAQRSRIGWLQLGAVLNPRAALDFDMIAEAAIDLRERYHPEKKDFDLRVGKLDPPNYLENYQFGIPQEWMVTIQDWEKELQQSSVTAEYQRYAMDLDNFRRAFAVIQIYSKALEEHMGESYFGNLGNVECFVDPHKTFRAVKSLESRLSGVDLALSAFVERFVIDASSPIDSQNQTLEANGMRRRQPRSATSPSTAAPESSSRSQPSEQQKMGYKLAGMAGIGWLTAALSRIASGQDCDALPHFPSYLARLFRPSQENLFAAAFIFGCIGALFVGVGTSQQRPASCVPNWASRDDGFWALLSQAFLQLLSVYATLVPLLRDRAVSLRSGLFCTLLAASAVAAVAAPVLYGASWRASGLASFVSAFASLMGVVMLAGGVQRHQRCLDMSGG